MSIRSSGATRARAATAARIGSSRSGRASATPPPTTTRSGADEDEHVCAREPDHLAGSFERPRVGIDRVSSSAAAGAFEPLLLVVPAESRRADVPDGEVTTRADLFLPVLESDNDGPLIRRSCVRQSFASEHASERSFTSSRRWTCTHSGHRCTDAAVAGKSSFMRQHAGARELPRGPD